MENNPQNPPKNPTDNGSGNNPDPDKMPIPTDEYNGMDGILTDSEVKQDQELVERLSNNIAEMRDEVSAGLEIQEKLEGKPSITSQDIKDLPISEAEAKTLLNDETHKLNQKLQNSNQKSRKTLILVIIMAVIICIAGLAFAIIMSSMNDKNSGNTNKPDQSQTTPTEPETPDEPEITELALDDEVVQKLYGNLKALDEYRVGAGQNYATEIYQAAVTGDEINDNILKSIALGAISPRDCQGAYAEDGEYATNGVDPICYDGEELRSKVQEIFGKTVELTDEEMIGGNGFCNRGYVYNAEHDQLYNIADGCGGSGGWGILREPYRAEQVGDEINIYEVAAVETPGAWYHVAGWSIDDIMGSEPVNDFVYPEASAEDYVEKYRAAMLEQKEKLDQFKWTFTKNSDGNYIFTSLEKID